MLRFAQRVPHVTRFGILFPTVSHIASAQSERNHWPGSLLSDAGLCPLGPFSTAPRPKRRDRYGEVPGMLWVILLFEAGVRRRPLCSKFGSSMLTALAIIE